MGLSIRLALVLQLLFLFAPAQELAYLDSIKKVHKGEDQVILEDYMKLVIDIDGENLLLTKEVKKRSYFLNNRAKFYSEDYVSGSTFTEVDKINFYTQIREKGKYKKVKSKNLEENQYIDDHVFYQDIKSYKITYPSLREDAISNFEYKQIIKEPRLMGGNYFQHYYPIIKLDYIVDVDENIDIDFAKFNFDSVEYKSDLVHKRGRKIYHFSAENLEKMKHEESSPSMKYIMPHMIPYIKTYKTKDKTIPLLRNPSDLYNWYSGLMKTKCKVSDELTATAVKIAEPYDNEIDKVKAIFKWVQENINYIAIEVGIGGFVPECASDVFRHKYGDCKGMANVLYHMLRAVEIESSLTWVGTIDLPYTYSDIPTPVVDNHMILTYISKEGRYYYLDATNQHVIFGLPSSFIQGKEVMISKGDTFEIRKVPIVDCNINQSADSVQLRYENGKIIGEGILAFGGYNFSRRRYKTTNIFDQEQRDKYVTNHSEKGNNKYRAFEASEITDKNKGLLKFKYKFSIEDYVTSTNDHMYFNMNLFKDVVTDRIKDDRENPMQFEMHNSYKYFVEFDIPENYQLEHLPEDDTFQNECYKFSIKYELVDNQKIRYNFYVSYEAMMLVKKDFHIYNAFLDRLNKNYREVVSFKR